MLQPNTMSFFEKYLLLAPVLYAILFRKVRGPEMQNVRIIARNGHICIATDKHTIANLTGSFGIASADVVITSNSIPKPSITEFACHRPAINHNISLAIS